MEKSSNPISIEDINKINLVEFLSSLGHQPFSKKDNEYRYLSPLKKEVFPTFVVFRDSNTWRESNSLTRKTLMDFAVQYFGCSIADLKNKLQNYLTQHAGSAQDQSQKNDFPIVILEQGQLSSSVLAIFVKKLRIPWDIAKEHCHQVEFGYRGRLHEGLAFTNDAGGLQIRNAFFDGKIGPEDKTFLNVGSQMVSVFGNFVDFLSYKSIQRPEPQPLTNCLILNSQQLQNEAYSVMNAHHKVRLYLPNTPDGSSITDRLTHTSSKYQDVSALYRHHSSLSDWVCNVGNSAVQDRQAGGQRLRRSG